MTRYVATINIPGYLPMDDDPPVFDTAAEAWWYLYHVRCDADAEALPDVPEHDCPWARRNPAPLGAPFCDVCDDAENDEDSETAGEIAQNARLSDRSRPFPKPDRIGTVYGPTPGSDSDHDLGLAYSVSIAEEES